MDDGAHALAERRALHTRRCVHSQGKASQVHKADNKTQFFGIDC